MDLASFSKLPILAHACSIFVDTGLGVVLAGSRRPPQRMQTMPCGTTKIDTHVSAELQNFPLGRNRKPCRALLAGRNVFVRLRFCKHLG